MLRNMATDAENHESVGFNFGRQSDSTYKFTRIRKNLDLFVMERNERHLTSLHWNWQKLPKSDDSSSPDTKTEDRFTPVISSTDNSMRRVDSKVRSRAQSRHRLQEDLKSVFYDRWKEADDLQRRDAGRRHSLFSTTAPIPNSKQRSRDDHRPSLPDSCFRHNRSNWSRHGRDHHLGYHRNRWDLNDFGSGSNQLESQNFRGNMAVFHDRNQNKMEWKQGSIPEFMKIARKPKRYGNGKESTGRGELCTPLEYHPPRAVTTDSRRSVYSVRDFAQEEGMVLAENMLTSFVSSSERANVQSAELWQKDSIFTAKTKRTVLAQFIGIEERRTTEDDVYSAAEDKIFRHSDDVIEELVNNPVIVSNNELRSRSQISEFIQPMAPSNANHRRKPSMSSSSDHCSMHGNEWDGSFRHSSRLVSRPTNKEQQTRDMFQLTSSSKKNGVDRHAGATTPESPVNFSVNTIKQQAVYKGNVIASPSLCSGTRIDDCSSVPAAKVGLPQAKCRPTGIDIFSRSPSADMKGPDLQMSQVLDSTGESGDKMPVEQTFEDQNSGGNQPSTVTQCEISSESNVSLEEVPRNENEFTRKNIALASNCHGEGENSRMKQQGIPKSSDQLLKKCEQIYPWTPGSLKHEGSKGDDERVFDDSSRIDSQSFPELNNNVAGRDVRTIRQTPSLMNLKGESLQSSPGQLTKEQTEKKLKCSAINILSNDSCSDSNGSMNESSPCLEQPELNSVLALRGTPEKKDLVSTELSSQHFSRSEQSINTLNAENDPIAPSAKPRSMHSGTSGDLSMVVIPDDKKFDNNSLDNSSQQVVIDEMPLSTAGSNEVPYMDSAQQANDGVHQKDTGLETEKFVFAPASSDKIKTDVRNNCEVASEIYSQQIPPGVAHEDLDMTEETNDFRTDTPYVTSSISDKIKAIKYQLSELNEEIDSKIANADLELEEEMNQHPPAYAFSKSQGSVIDATLPEECLSISHDQDAENSLRPTDEFIEIHSDLVDDEKFARGNVGPTVEQEAWTPNEIYKGVTASIKSDIISRKGSDRSRNLDEEYLQNSRNSEVMESTPDLRRKYRNKTIDLVHQSQELGLRMDVRHQATSPGSSKKTIRSLEIRPDLKERKHSWEYKTSDSPEIKQSLPFCRHSMDNIHDSTVSLTLSDTSSERGIKTNTATTRRKNTGFRRSSHRVTNSALKNDLENFPESEKDSGCQAGYGRESASTLWRSTLSGKKSESYSKKQRTDSTVSVSQVRNRFFDEDKNSQDDVLEEIDYDIGVNMDSSSSIPKALILEKEGTISEISGDFINEKAERDKFSNNDSSEIWTEKRAESKRSLLEGLGTSYCVLPNFIWKYIGQDTDDEPMTRKKCIAFILGAILTVLLIALLLGLIIGIVTSASQEEFSPIRFTVIPGIPGENENLGDSAPE